MEAIVLIWVESLVPTEVTALMITTPIRAEIRPYSIAVAPDSSFRKVFTKFVIGFRFHTQDVKRPKAVAHLLSNADNEISEIS